MSALGGGGGGGEDCMLEWEGLVLGHVNKISCFSSFCLQKFGEGGGYLLFIFRGQRSYATIFTGVKLGYKRRVKGRTGTTQVKKE